MTKKQWENQQKALTLRLREAARDAARLGFYLAMAGDLLIMVAVNPKSPYDKKTRVFMNGKWHKLVPADLL